MNEIVNGSWERVKVYRNHGQRDFMGNYVDEYIFLKKMFVQRSDVGAGRNRDKVKEISGKIQEVNVEVFNMRYDPNIKESDVLYDGKYQYNIEGINNNFAGSGRNSYMQIVCERVAQQFVLKEKAD